MRIAVMATGGVGGYFGAKLAQGGHDVAFVARGRHLAAMRERGLAVKSATGDVHIARADARRGSGGARTGRRRRSSPSSSGTPKARPRALRPLVAKGAVVVPFQNGVESIERIGARRRAGSA